MGENICQVLTQQLPFDVGSVSWNLTEGIKFSILVDTYRQAYWDKILHYQGIQTALVLITDKENVAYMQ